MECQGGSGGWAGVWGLGGRGGGEKNLLSAEFSWNMLSVNNTTFLIISMTSNHIH